MEKCRNQQQRPLRPRKDVQHHEEIARRARDLINVWDTAILRSPLDGKLNKLYLGK